MRKFNHNFKRQFGQNFLKYRKDAEKIVDYLGITEEDVVVEIGPGDGRLTEILLEKAKKVIAIEVDYDLIVELVRKFGDNQDFELIHKSFMDITFQDLLDLDRISEEELDNYKMIGSLPYNLSKRIISNIFELESLPSEVVFMIQAEVADSYTASAPQATFLSNWLSLRADVDKGPRISNKKFYPEPKVDGGIFKFKPVQKFDSQELQELTRIVRIGFQNPRKTLANNLKSLEEVDRTELKGLLAEAGLEKARAAELTLEDWIELKKNF